MAIITLHVRAAYVRHIQESGRPLTAQELDKFEDFELALLDEHGDGDFFVIEDADTVYGDACAVDGRFAPLHTVVYRTHDHVDAPTPATVEFHILECFACYIAYCQDDDLTEDEKIAFDRTDCSLYETYGPGHWSIDSDDSEDYGHCGITGTFGRLIKVSYVIMGGAE